jgi:hypothetical protein
MIAVPACLPLAFVPLYDPLFAVFPGMSEQWLWLVIPLVVVISLVYKCTRVQSLGTLPRDAAIMCLEIIVVMVLAAVVLAAGYWGYLRITGRIVH